RAKVEKRILIHAHALNRETLPLNDGIIVFNARTQCLHCVSQQLFHLYTYSGAPRAPIGRARAEPHG
ncbi:MAG: hypothetical protein OIF58_16455, partial [Cohaesibacter sp.]|nr:hypothetical protein [Cohaesibacter sp.]